MSHKPEYVKNNVLALAKGASILDIPVILTVISPQTNGPMISEITEMFPDVSVIVRKHPSFNAFDEPEFVQAIKNTGRNNLYLLVCGRACVCRSAHSKLCRKVSKSSV